MPTLIFQTNRRLKNVVVKKAIRILTIIFSTFMVIGRLHNRFHLVHQRNRLFFDAKRSFGVFGYFYGHTSKWGRKRITSSETEKECVILPFNEVGGVKGTILAVEEKRNRDEQK